MTGLPVYFRTGQSMLANYNFVDIASGTGYIELYGGGVLEGDNKKTILSNKPFYSHTMVGEANKVSGCYSLNSITDTSNYQKVLDLGNIF